MSVLTQTVVTAAAQLKLQISTEIESLERQLEDKMRELQEINLVCKSSAIPEIRAVGAESSTSPVVKQPRAPWGSKTRNGKKIDLATAAMSGLLHTPRGRVIGTSPSTRKPVKKYKISPEGLARIRAAQKKRWARHRTAKRRGLVS